MNGRPVEGALSGVRVGIVGLGTMGGALGRRLRALGGAVEGYNRGAARAARFAADGWTVYDSPERLARGSDVVLIAVGATRDVEEVLFGERGVARGARPGTTVIDLSTIDPLASRSFAGALGERGIRMIDAPMSGSVDAAEHGTLGFLVGGNAETVRAMTPLLETIGSHVHHFGENGAGCAAKLALNLVLAGMVQSLAEALDVMAAGGLSQALFLDALDTSGLRSPAFRRVGERALHGDLRPRFALRHLHKDLCLLLRFRERLSVQSPLAEELGEILRAALAERGELDYAALIKPSGPRAAGVMFQPLSEVQTSR